MTPFAYAAPCSRDEAVGLLATPGARVLAGGTDLLALMRRGVEAPSLLVSLRRVPELDQIRAGADGGLVLGAAATLSQLAAAPQVARQYPLLLEALEQLATPQIRNAATVGGNLCQRPRCHYLRHPAFACTRSGGQGCPARSGQNRYHAIFGAHGCAAVHPSDLAPALVALEAVALAAGPRGERCLSLADFFAGPERDPRRETVLATGELLAAVHLPPAPAGARGTFLKVTERRAADFALVSLAAVVAGAGPRPSHVRLVLGGVAPVPWRLQRAEETVLEAGLTDEAIRRAAELAVDGACALSQNAYKVRLATALVRRALDQLRRADCPLPPH
ncbi:MAG: FAD binding domain-containing protein [Gemmatimonadota bacterium]